MVNHKFIINQTGQIEAVDYTNLVWQFVDETTTPQGVAPRLHIREETWYRVDGQLFEKQSEATDAADDVEADTGIRPEIDEITRFEVWTWGYQGNFPKQIRVFDTRNEAEEYLFECAETDFFNNPDAPMVFDTQDAAEQWLAENAE